MIREDLICILQVECQELVVNTDNMDSTIGQVSRGSVLHAPGRSEVRLMRFFLAQQNPLEYGLIR